MILVVSTQIHDLLPQVIFLIVLSSLTPLIGFILHYVADFGTQRFVRI